MYGHLVTSYSVDLLMENALEHLPDSMHCWDLAYYENGIWLHAGIQTKQTL